MRIMELMAELADAGVTLRRSGEQLKVTGPSGALSASLLERLRESKQALLDAIEDKVFERASAVPPTPGEGGNTCVLSPGQQYLVLATRLGDPAMYNEQAAIEFAGAVEPAAIADAFTRLARKHDILRTVFSDDEPMRQTVLPDAPIHVETAAVRDDDELRARAESLARMPFASTGLLWRVDLFARPDRPLVLVLTIHHAIFDRWTMILLIRDFSAFLAAPDEAGASSAASPRLSYRDFTAWQRRWLDSDEYGTHLDWWGNALAGIDEAAQIRGDRPRPPVPSWRGATVRLPIPADDLRVALAFSRQSGTTLFTTLLSVFQLFLCRYTGESQALTLTPAANRPFQAAEEIAGYFINLVVLAGTVRDDDSFRSLVERTRGVAAQAFAHQGVPFEAVVERLRSAGGPGRDQLAHAVFALQNVRLPAIHAGGGDATPFALDSPFARFDLYLSIEGDERGMFAVWQYSCDLFDAATVRRLGTHYLALLREALASPDAPAHSLPMLEAGEARQLLHDWNDTPPTGEGFLLHTGIERHAARCPQAPAVISVDHALNYRELAAQVRRVAAAVAAAGAQREPVAVFLPRSPYAVAAYAGVMQSGCAYVPTDPAMPPRRLQDVLGAIGFVVTTRALAGRLEGVAARVIVIDDDDEAVADLPDVTLDDLAYVLFTSGSTGKPKGVMIDHRAASLTIDAILRQHAIGAQDRLLCVSAASFDLSVFDFFGAFAAGAAVVLAPESTDVEPRVWLDLMERERVTVWESVPAVMELLLAECRRSGRTLPPSLRLVMLSGDRVPVRLPALVREATASEVRVMALGGATEAAIWSCCFDTAELAPDAAFVPYGRHLPGQRLYVLSAARQPVPVGAPGELWIAGSGVARGYLGELRLTAERFVDNPFVAGERMYKTGDRVRVLPDGNHEFLGRVDNQVKIGGFRIEIGEIETALADAPGVERGVAAIVERDGRPMIVGYVLPVAGVPPEVAAIRDALRRRLPVYMLPAAIVPIEAVPLNVNGKVDRTRLPAPPEPSASPRNDVALTPNEALLIGILREVLGSGDISLDANYFVLGGDSIRSLRIAARARELGFELRPRALIEKDSIAAIAATITPLADETAPLWADARSVEGVASLMADMGDVEEVYPLTPMQEGMLYHALGGGGMYVEQLACTLTGAVDEGALRAAWGDVIESNPVLRTSFHWEGVVQPVQVVHASASAAWREESWPQGLDVGAWLRADRAEGLELRRAPCLRCALLHTGEDRRELVVTYSHLLLDGWSLSLLIGELVGAYAARVTGGMVPRAPRSPFSGYVAWSRSAWERGAGEDFWRAELGGFDGTRELTLPAPSGDEGSADGAPVTVEIDRGALEGLEKRERVTLASVVAGCWAVLLSRYGASDDVLFGVTSSGRRAEVSGSESMVGVLIETRPARIQVDGQAPLGAWLREVMQAEARREEAGAVSLAQIERWGGAERGARLFDTLVVVENYPVAKLGDLLAGGIGVESVRVVERTNWPLTVVAVPEDGRLKLRLLYDPARYGRASIEQVARHLARLLNAATQAPRTATVGDLAAAMLSDAEHAQLREWGTHTEPYRADATVATLFRERAAAHPERIALEQDGARWSYAELDRWSDRAADALRSAGAGRGAVVGVAGERSPRLIAALIAVLKTGAAYLPLDASYPAARLRMMIADADPALMLLADELDANWLGDYAGPVLRLSDCERLAAPRPGASAVGANQAAGDLAYVMYTSGSTGRPKGVCVAHRGIVRLATGGAYARLDESTVMMQLSPLGFDASTFEIWGSLLNGGRLVLAPPGVPLVETIAGTIAHYGVTTMWLTADLFRLMVEERPAALGSLRELLSGGDVLPIASCRAFVDACPDVTLINGYGPTENTTFTCSHRVTADDVRRASIPIGRPIGNTQVLVVDAHGRLTPPGAPGELWAAGDGLALGYLGRADLSAERFVEVPALGGGRWYRSGDLVRWRRDGALEFLGRADTQIKLRGFRIELSEIEAALGEHPALSSCAVALQHSAADEKQLVAYLVARAGLTVDTADVQAWLEARLPGYMVPRAWMWLDMLPQSANGKIDRQALPQASAPTAPAEGPRSAAEAALAAIWCEVLGRDTIGVHENFFDAGGDSILAIRIVARAREQRIHIMPRDILERQTIAKIAAATGSAFASDEPDDETAAPLPPMARWFFAQQPPEPDGFHQSVLLRVPPQVEVSAIRVALETLVAIHESLRTAYLHEAGGWRQQVIRQVRPTFEIVKLPDAGDDALEEAADRLRTSIRIEHGALLAAGLLESPDGARRLLLIAHHLAVDAVSWQIIIDQIASLCRGSDLGAAPTTMRRWTRRRIDWAAAAPAGLLDQLLGDASLAAPLPLDGTDDAGNAAASREQSCVLDRTATSRIISGFAAAEGYRIDEVTAAAVARAVMRWSGRDDVVIDLESHGRNGFANDPEVAFTVGWFTTIMPAMIRGGTLKETLQSVRAAIRSSSEHGADYQALCYLKGPVLDWSPRPLLFNFLGRLEATAGEWRLLQAGIGRDRAPSMPRSHLLDVMAAIVDGSLHVRIGYNRHAHRDDTVARLIADIQATLSEFGMHETIVDAAGGDVEEVYPLTPMQEGMLYHALGGGGMYVEQLACTLTGAVDEGALRAAWGDVIESNPVLRTSFHWEGVVQPVQVVHASASAAWREESWPQGLDVGAWLRADRAEGLELRRAPCLRCALLHTGEDRRELVVTYSHLLLDGWSLSLLIGELVGAYAARVTGGMVPRAPRSPFSGYVAWSRSAWERGAGEDFWRAELGGFDGTRELTLPAPSGDEGSADGAPVTVEIDRGALEGLEKRERVTLASVVAGCWAVLLSRYGASDDVLFGVTSSGRRAEVSGSESMVGVLIETRPARIQVDGQAPLGAWLREVMQAEARREEAGAVSLAQIERWGGAERGARLFDTLVVVENYPVAKLGDLLAGGIGVESVRVVERTNWPLTVVAVPEDGRLKLRLLYDPARYGRASIEQVARHLARLLNAAAQAPRTAAVGDLAAAMLDEIERETLLVHWSGADQVLASPRRTIVERIEEQALARPEAAALRLGERRISYAELTARGRRIAAWLQDQGAGAGVRVAIVGERTIETIVAMYGILTSGAAYVPLDPGWPDERKGLVIEDAQPLLVIGSGAWCGGVRQIELAELEEAAQDAAPTQCQATAEDLAYVIYTSGSTGRPKGVMVRHGDVMHLDGLRERMGLNESDVWTAFHSYAFDYSILEIWYPLMTGATVVPVPYWITRSPEAFHDLLRTEGATIVCQTPAAFQQLAAVPHRGLRVRWVVMGGDACHASSIAGADPVEYPRIANLYGITETTVLTTFEPLERGRQVTIGRPIPGQRVYLLDRHGRLAPPSATGEIHIAGEGIAAGYLGAPALTAQRFVVDPHRPDERMYRSGDLGRFLADGRLEFLGRADSQVKIRGYRIELGEIERTLSSLAGIDGAVVDVREGVGGRRLVAWYAAAACKDAQQVRAALKQRLPDSMMPSVLIRVDGFALTANGKIDRRALPQESVQIEPAQGPRNALEKTLAAIWCEVLGRDAIGVHENFFDAGGDSLAIVRAHGLMTDRLPGAERLRVVDLFQQPTIAAIASQIATGDARQATADEPDERARRRRRRTMERRQKIEREYK
ncbi:non-ribosomal peptide synthetase [Burkholderia sp. TSV86]|uniref:non-ribosomal peptide synthetase n=1 Tax=Burkholderia sp. TSV86 TaxID=1385594 RepID=UPI000755933F|nr:non-ribosomal peptide synthetase [Burkholderia sp. TSV86]KVE40097.1 non-ribosomal peptide synthetase [Burkholderia sp. TSV86]